MLENYQKALKEITIDLGNKSLKGLLHVPKKRTGIVIFAHGSGSSRFSPRNQYVASGMSKAGLATLLFDLLTPEEEAIDDITREYRFDIPMLADRLVEVTEWVSRQEKLKELKIGYIGSSTGAGAALIAAGKLKNKIGAVVSRGGRPDLAKEYLKEVTAPTILIVGSLDFQVIELNKEAQAQMTNHNKLELIEGATHLFEEKGTLEKAAAIATKWLSDFLSKPVEDE